MTIYILFGGHDELPEGGTYDIIAISRHISEIRHIRAQHRPRWWHIVQVDTSNLGKTTWRDLELGG